MLSCSAPSTVMCIWHWYNPPHPLITKSVLDSLSTAFLSCPLSLCGLRTVCHKRHSYRLLIFAVSSLQPSRTAVKYIQRKEDRGRDRERECTTHPCQTESSRLFLQERSRRQERYLHWTCPLTCSLYPHLFSHLLTDKEVQPCKSPAELSGKLQHTPLLCAQIL